MEKTMQNPKLIPVPFANSGIKDDIPKVKSSSMSDEKASWETGFPEETMLPVYAGGLPPDGKDFNGVLNQISENLVFQSKGGRYKFDPDFALSVGGYPKGATLQTNDESAEYQSLIDNNLVNFNTATPEEISQAWRITGLGDATEVLNGKFDKASVKNELGLSQTEVVSQNVVTELGSGIVGSFEDGLNFIVELTNSDQLITLENEFGKQAYCWTGEFPKQVPAGSTPQSTGGIAKGAWVSVGDASLRNDVINGNGELLGLSYNNSQVNFDANKYVQLRVFADLFIENYSRVIDGIHAACDYVQGKGGGVVYLSAKTYLLEDELIPRDTVKVVGNLGGYWSGLTTLKWAGGDGTNKCVIRASSAPLGSLTTTALASTGVVDCHIDAEGCDVGFYSQYVTNGSDFSGLVVKNATKINIYILKSWFCDYKNISSIRSKGKGIVIAQPMFGEVGQMNVNACGFSSLKAHSNGVNTPNGSSSVENGTGIVLGMFMAANFIESIQSEGNKGIGLLSYSTYTNSIGSLYIESNAANLDGSLKNCGFMYENGGSFSALSISSLHLAINQYVINNVDLGLIIQSLGRNDNVASFKGTGRALITSSNLGNFSATDWSKIASDNTEIMSGKRINSRYNSSFDLMSCLLSENIGYPHIVIVPRDNYTYSNDLVIGFLSQSSGANFGKKFAKGDPIVRRISPLTKGFQKLDMLSNPMSFDNYFDVYVMYAKARMGGQIHPTLVV